MNKLLVVFTLISLPCLATTKAEQADKARTELQYLWNSTGALTREYLIEVTLDLPNAKAVAQHLLKNQEAIGNVFASLYGKEKGQKVTELLKKQGTLTLALINAAKKKDNKVLKETETAWKKNACALSMFLDKTNPYIQYGVLHNLLLEYLTKLTTMTVDRIEKKWDDDIINYDAVRAQLHKIVSTLGKALTDAFPKPKEKVEPPKRRVTVPLPPGTSLRKRV